MKQEASGVPREAARAEPAPFKARSASILVRVPSPNLRAKAQSCPAGRARGRIHTLARYQAVLVSGGDLGTPIEALLEGLVRFLTAGLEAPAAPRGTSAASRSGRGKSA